MKAIERRWWRTWVVRYALGELVGIGVAASILSAVGGRGDASTGVLVAALVATGCVEGAALASFTYEPLRRRLPATSRSGWIGVTALAAVAAWLAGYASAANFGADAGPIVAPPSAALVLAAAAALGACLGAALGAAQWLVLRRAAREAWRWIPANAWGWSIGMVIIFAGAGLPSATTPLGWMLVLGALTGLVAGAAVGAITGLSLMRMQPHEDATATATDTHEAAASTSA